MSGPTARPQPKTRADMRALGDTIPADLWAALFALDEEQRSGALRHATDERIREHIEARERAIDRVAEHVPWRPVLETQLVRAPHGEHLISKEAVSRQRFLRVVDEHLAHRGLHPGDLALFHLQTGDQHDSLDAVAIPGDVVCVAVDGVHLLGEYRSEEWIDVVVPDGRRLVVTGEHLLGPVLEVHHHGYTFYGIRCLEGVPRESLIFWAPRVQQGDAASEESGS